MILLNLTVTFPDGFHLDLRESAEQTTDLRDAVERLRDVLLVRVDEKKAD